MELATYGSTLADVFVTLYNSAVKIIPDILGAIVILLIGYFVGWFLSYLLEKALQKAKLDEWMVQNTGLKKAIGNFKLSHFLGLIVKWYVFALFFHPASSVVRLGTFASLLEKMLLWIPNIIAAVVIAMFGILIANYSMLKIEHVNFHGSKLVGKISQVLILIFTFMIALEQMNIKVSIAKDSFLIILAGVMLALGLGFGLGMQKEAEKVIKSWKKKI